MSAAAFDTVIDDGLYFDGTGSAPRRVNVGIRDGVVAELSTDRLPRGGTTRVVDAAGCWVMPGFIDCHTHYDAEVELAPSLSESLRHGVTTVMLGSCSLSLALGTPEDLADMFCRVEAIPYEIVRRLLDEKKTWETLGEYLAHLDGLPLGPNVASFVGHSAVRAHVMGIERSLDKKIKPTKDEMLRMEALIEEGLDLGYIGASIQTLPWDKMGGDRDLRSRPLPSCFASWSEYRRITRILRRRGRVFQGVPNISTKVNALLFLIESAGLLRRPLKTTIISMMDLCGQPGIPRLIGGLSRVFNRFLGADFRWQALPELFDLWADGIDLVVFEEFGAGTAALHLLDPTKRAALLHDPAYRRRFRRQWNNPLSPKAFHRNFASSKILACPDTSLIGKSFADVGAERGGDGVDAFLDLVAEHGTSLRWYTIMANERPRELEWIVSHPDVVIGFSDAGAHLRQMAHYNFPLRMLRLVREAELRGEPFMSVERAVHRLTGELGAWFGIDAGTLGVGKRADLVVVDPAALDESVERAEEAEMPAFEGFVRLVRRNDRAVRGVWVSGREAVTGGAVVSTVGQERGYGRVLRAAHRPN